MATFVMLLFSLCNDYNDVGALLSNHFISSAVHSTVSLLQPCSLGFTASNSSRLINNSNSNGVQCQQSQIGGTDLFLQSTQVSDI